MLAIFAVNFTASSKLVHPFGDDAFQAVGDRQRGEAGARSKRGPVRHPMHRAMPRQRRREFQGMQRIAASPLVDEIRHRGRDRAHAQPTRDEMRAIALVERREPQVMTAVGKHRSRIEVRRHVPPPSAASKPPTTAGAPDPPRSRARPATRNRTSADPRQSPPVGPAVARRPNNSARYQRELSARIFPVIWPVIRLSGKFSPNNSPSSGTHNGLAPPREHSPLIGPSNRRPSGRRLPSTPDPPPGSVQGPAPPASGPRGKASIDEWSRPWPSAVEVRPTEHAGQTRAGASICRCPARLRPTHAVLAPLEFLEQLRQARVPRPCGQ
jgi:hypothetical protein